MTDIDGVGRVKWDGGVRGLAETGHASTSRRSCGGQVEMDGLGGLGLKATVHAGFSVLASKPGRVRCGCIVEVEGIWRYREACVETKQNREDGVSVRYFCKMIDRFALLGWLS